MKEINYLCEYSDVFFEFITTLRGFIFLNWESMFDHFHVGVYWGFGMVRNSTSLPVSDDLLAHIVVVSLSSLN
jgi:hypothetical protein